MRASSRRRARLAAVFVLAAVALAARTNANEPGAVAGGTADGWFEVAKERTSLRFAWVLGEAGDGASDELVVVLADRELDAGAISSEAARDALASEGGARSVTARLPGEGGEIVLLLHHPRIPAGLSLRGLARFVPESVTAARLEGRILLPGATAVEAWFSAPIERRERTLDPELEEKPQVPRAAMSLEEAIESGGEEEFESALAAATSLESVGGGGMRPLAAAASAGNLYAVRRLLEAGAEVDGRADRASLSALMHAAGKESPAVIDALLAAGANPKLRTSSGSSALMMAVFEGRLENAKRLIAAGAEVARDREVLVRLAREKGYAELEALLRAPAP